MHYMLTIDRIEGDKAVLRDEFENTIILPKSKVPAGATEGSVLHLRVEENQDTKDQKNETAKQILNEILNSSE